jgi:hypothetical protein
LRPGREFAGQSAGDNLDGGATTDIGQGAGNLGRDAGKAVGQDMNKITKGIGGLFKKSTN